MAAAGCGSVLAGCGGPTVDGAVVANETPLVIAHEYAVRGTPSGTVLVVDVTAENQGQRRITPDGQVPELTCAFLNDAGEPLHQPGIQPLEPIDVGAATTFQFKLGTNLSEVTRYELMAAWISDDSSSAAVAE
jgi:hypothetical protein